MDTGGSQTAEVISALWLRAAPGALLAGSRHMSDLPRRLVIADPYPETIGVSALTIFVPDDFRGDAEVIWWYPDKPGDESRQRITCNSTALLQGVLRDVRGARPGELFDARVVALVVHEFYRRRLEAAARLPAAYQWQAFPPPH